MLLLKIPLTGEGWGETPIVKSMKSGPMKVVVEEPAVVLYVAADKCCPLALVPICVKQKVGGGVKRH